MRFRVVRINKKTKEIGVIDLDDFIVEDYSKEYLCKVCKKYPIYGVQSTGRITCESIFNSDFEVKLLQIVDIDCARYSSISERVTRVMKTTKSGFPILGGIKEELYYCGLSILQMREVEKCIKEELRR